MTACNVELLWAGGVTDTTAMVKVCILGTLPTQVRLRYSTSPTLTPASFSAVVAPDSAGWCEFNLTGLTARIRYYYAVEIVGDDRLDSQRAWFKTAPTPLVAANFTVAVSACSASGSAGGAQARLAEHDPDLFIHTGDFHYDDITVNDPALYRAAVVNQHAQYGQARMFRTVPIDVTWSDHDFGADGSYGGRWAGVGLAPSPSKAAAQAAFPQCYPHHPFPLGGGNISHAFTLGRTRWLLPDMRSERDHPDVVGASIMGATTKAWLKSELSAANGVYPLVVIISDPGFIGTSGDGWSNYTAERTEIMEHIAVNCRQAKVAMICGDVHGLAYDDGTHSDYSTTGLAKPMPVLQSGALSSSNAIYGGPFTSGTLVSAQQAYTMMTVTDDGTTVSVAWSLRTVSSSAPAHAAETERYAYSFTSAA